MKLRFQNTRLTIQVLGWFQIIGGITGLGAVATLMLQTEEVNGAVLLMFLIGIALFLFSIYAGIRLLTDQRKNTAIILSMVNQALQLFQWSMLGYALTFSAGGELTIGIKGLGLTFNFAMITSNFAMAINSDSDFFLKLNLIPVLVIYLLVDILRELKRIPVDPIGAVTESIEASSGNR